jgi:hypothetical protein
MATPIETFTEEKLLWQGAFNGALSDAGHFGYRGSLIIEPGRVLAADKQLPPKSVARQVIMTTNSTVFTFFACELETFDDFGPLFARYKEYFTPEGLYALFVIDLDGNATFEYEGVTFHAFALDESSVWNELLDYADLSKGDLKKLKPAEKIETIVDALDASALSAPTKSYEEVVALKSDTAKQVFGAV